MESRQGISEAQARKLMELAQKNGRICNVKLINKDIRGKPNRGILKKVLGNGRAIVRPFKHGHDEEELLSNIYFWKSGCDFDITEAMSMPSAVDFRKPLGERISIPTSVVPNGAPAGEFVIFSAKMKSVWGGHERRWTQNFNLANKWRDHGDGMRAIGKINKVPMQDDAKLLPIGEAHDALLEVLTAPSTPEALPFKPQTPPPTPPTVVQLPRPTAPAIPASILAVAKPQPSFPIDLDDDDLIDLDVLLGKDSASLKLAEEERMKAVAEYGLAKKAAKAAQIAVELAFQKFAALDQRVAELGGHPSIKTAKQTKPQRGKRLRLFPSVKDILTTHSRLDLGGIYDRLLVEFPELTREKLSKNLSNYKAQGLADRDDNGGWSLTSEGRRNDDDEGGDEEN
jgi:hypothetical protein